MNRKRGVLHRSAIVDAAVAVADEGGLASLTMRGIARRLGVEAMSLYHHIPDRQALVDAAADRVWSELDPTTAGEWPARLRTISTRAYSLLCTHPWLLDVASAAGGRGRMQMIETILGALTEAGLAQDEVFEGYHLIDSVILGYATQEVSYRGGIEHEIPAELVHVKAHAAAHAERAGTARGIEYGLDLVIDSLTTQAVSG